MSADLDEIDVAQLQVGMPVHLSLDSNPDLKLEGTIKFVSPLAVPKETDKAVHVFPIVVSLQTADPRLKVGLTANFSIPVSHVDKTLSLPISMVFEDDETSYVYVKEQGKIHAQEHQGRHQCRGFCRDQVGLAGGRAPFS